MLVLARAKGSSKSPTSSHAATWLVGDMTKLPVSSATFDLVTTGYGLRNVPDLPAALAEIHRVLKPGGAFTAVVDLYLESEATHHWIETLNVPVQLLSAADYRSMFEAAGFTEVRDERVLDPRPVPDDYTSGSFKSREDYVRYREEGSLMMSGQPKK